MRTVAQKKAAVNGSNRKGAPDVTTPAVAVKDLHKSFGSQKVLDGIDLQVRQGETLAVLGRSGIGKSVLLKLIIGLQKPDSGAVLIQGKDIGELKIKQLDELRKKIGFLFQGAALYDSMTVEENVAFPLRRHTGLAGAELKQRVQELLGSVGMEQDARKLPSQISGGMQKRVGMARALALDPEILLFDEPTAGLDPITADEIGKLIVELRKKHSVTSIVVTHDIHTARQFADRVALINEGHIVADSVFDELTKSRDPFVRRFLREAA
jgi:phospholipid/cholesterol/gamma-HCH transport system ATP-binding protein